MRAILAAILGVLISSTPAAAWNDTQLAKLEPTGPWNLEYDKWLCRLNRPYVSGTRSVQFSFAREPLTAKNWLYLFFEGETGQRDDGDASLFIDGELTRDDLHYNIFDAPGFRVRQIWIDLDQIALGETTSTLKFELARHGDIEVPVPGFQSAWDALDTCMEDLYESYGVDMEAYRSMASKPEGRVLTNVNPPRAPADFAFFYWVDAEGRVDECNLVKPSGDEGFDESFCDQLIRKARLEPAKDAAGNAIRVPQFENVRLRVSFNPA